MSVPFSPWEGELQSRCLSLNVHVGCRVAGSWIPPESTDAFLVPGRAGIDGGATEAAEVSRDQPATTRDQPAATRDQPATTRDQPATTRVLSPTAVHLEPLKMNRVN